MNQPSNIPQSKISLFRGGREGSIRLAINVAIIAGVFSALISILMLFNYFQLSTNNPIESEALDALVERLKSDPNNEQLLSEVRAFDLMARKAYFTSKWQIETGGILLLLGAIIIVVALRYYFKATFKIDEPENNPVTDQMARVVSSKWLLGMGFVLILAALGASFFSVNYFDKYQAGEIAVVADSTQIASDEIEQVDLTVSTDTVTSDSTNTTVSTSETALATVAFPSVDAIKKQYATFRGPLGQGVSSVKAPTSWDAAAGTNMKWKVKLPKKGFSSPVVWGDKLFITSADNQERWVYCVDANSGKMIWQQQANNIQGTPTVAPKTTADTGLAAPTAVTDGNVVVAIFGTGDIIAFDMTGKRIWARNLGVPDNHYGHSSSLLMWKEKVVVQYDSSKGGRMLAINAITGETIWDVKRTNRISWASPILAQIGGKMQIITSSDPLVAGHDVETGKELWKVSCLSGEVGPSPAFGNGLVFAANEYATLAAIEPGTGKIVWQSNEYLPEVASPVVSDGLVFIATSYGVLACYDAHSGNKYWEYEASEGFYASPVIAGGVLYAFDTGGNAHIFKVSRESEEVATVKMGEKVVSTPAFGDGRIYVRGMENLYCIGK